MKRFDCMEELQHLQQKKLNMNNNRDENKNGPIYNLVHETMWQKKKLYLFK